MPGDENEIVTQLVDLLQTQLKEQSDTTRKTLFWMFALMSFLLVANGALSGVNLALEFYGMTMGSHEYATPVHMVEAAPALVDTAELREMLAEHPAPPPPEDEWNEEDLMPVVGGPTEPDILKALGYTPELAAPE